MNKEKALETLSTHKAQWVEKYGLTKLGLFGLVARDQAHEGSDVDVIIKMTSPDISLPAELSEDLVDA